VTVPLEFGLGGMRNLESMRSISLFGPSDIRCYFDWGSDYYQDRTETINQLETVSLPQGVRAGISPENPIGEIYRYTVESRDHDLIKEKEIEDWVLEQQLKTVPGVIDVSGFGGLSKEYHVDVDPQRLAYYRIPLSTLLATLGNANINAGGNYLDVGEQAFDVRGLGFIESLDDIRNAVLTVNKSTPVTVANVASVEAGYAPRLGIVGMNNRNEIVEGIVLMRKYGNTLKTLRGVESKINELNSSGALPAGYKAVPYYDRTELVETTLHTVLENLTIGMALVFLVLIFFLGNFQSLYRRHQHTACAARRIHPEACGRHAGQPDFARRHRLRHHHQLDRHRGREHPSLPGARGGRGLLSAYPARDAGSRRSDLFFHLDLRDRVPPVVHDARGRGRDLFTDVADVRLCARRRHPALARTDTGSGLVRVRARPASVFQSDMGGYQPLLSLVLCAPAEPPAPVAHGGHDRRDDRVRNLSAFGW